MLETVFSSLDLGEGETKTYLALLESGSTTAGRQARKLRIPRSTLYGFLA